MKTMRKTTELYKQRTIISVVCLSCIYIYFVLSKYVCAFVSVCFVLHSLANKRTQYNRLNDADNDRYDNLEGYYA